MLSYLIYINKKVLAPFDKLKTFARNVAAGNLAIPLSMDEDNVFGAFTESFDIMREELAKSRENERRANESKKELVASLSHDIKTPLASIKAIAELMEVQLQEEKFKNKVNTIWNKADQIELLTNNLFHATLEELKELKVENQEEASGILGAMLQNCDYLHRIDKYEVPECLIICDKLRLQQVFDNIISNSYKYANTNIIVTFQIKEDNLEIRIQDFGQGVDDEDLPLLFTKYYRGQNSEGRSGAGIGLYISKYFIEKMGGRIEALNENPGFCVRIEIPLA